MAESDEVPSIKVVRTSSTDETKGILKKRGRIMTPEERAKRVSASIQWDEMNILATEHPPDKDYGHMKIDEPKTPYHEPASEDDIDSGNAAEVNPQDLAEQVLKAQNEPTHRSKWERDSDSEEDMLTDEAKEKQKGFKEWRKAHYNEFAAVQRARELMKEDEEELRRLEEEEERMKQEKDEEMEQQ